MNKINEQQVDAILIKLEEICDKILKENKLQSLSYYKHGDATFYGLGYKEHISTEKFLTHVKNHLFDKGTPLFLDLINQGRKRKSLLGFLFKNKIENELLENIFNIAFNPPNCYFHFQTIHQAKIFDTHFEKAINLLICKNYHNEYSLDSSILQNLTKFKLQKENYPDVQHLLACNKEYIETHKYMVTPILINLLKQSIEIKDWNQFREFFPKNEFPTVDKCDSIFENNSSPSYNLVINNNSIKNRYPKFSFHSEYTNMIQNTIEIINLNKQKLNLNHVGITGLEEKKTFVSFFGDINEKKIQNLVISLIDNYCQNYIDEKHQDAINHVSQNFDRILLNCSLENKLPVKNDTSRKLKI